MPKLKVDGVNVEVPAGATVLQACEAAGRVIARTGRYAPSPSADDHRRWRGERRITGRGGDLALAREVAA